MCHVHKIGGLVGEANGMYRHGRHTRQAKEVGALMREIARTGEAFAARVMNQHGLKPPKAIRRRRHVKKAIEAAAKAKPKDGTT
jgi:hypothetical protein